MVRRMKVCILPVVLVLFPFSLLANPTELSDIGDSQVDPLLSPFAYAGYTAVSGDLDLPGNSVDFDYEQFRLYTPLNPSGLSIGENTQLFFELDYTFTSIELEDSGATLELDELHRLSLPITALYDQPGTPWKFFARIAPEISTNFENVNSDDYGLNALLGAHYTFSDTLSIYGGIANTRSFGDEQILPLIGLDWKINDKSSLQIKGAIITYSYQISHDLIFRAGSFPSGGYWNYGSDGQEDAQIGLVTQNVGLGLDYRVHNDIWLSLRGGAALAGEFSIAESNGGNRDEEDIEDAVFGYIGFRVYSW